MPRVAILSLDDPWLETYRDLKKTNRTRWSGQFIVEGEKLVRRLLVSEHPVVSVLVSTKHLTQIQSEVPDHVPLLIVPDELVERIVGFNFHRGVLACGERLPGPSLDELASRRSSPLTLVVCPDVQDPENLGALLRICASLGVDGVVLGKACGNPFSRRVLRVSMGAVLRLPLVTSNDLAKDLRRLRELHGVQLVATVVDPAANSLDSFERPDRLAILFGSEGHGLAPQLVELCDHRLTIPMQLGTDSLNVAVATGIILYHLTRG